MKLSMLSQIDEKNFHEAQANAEMTATYKFLGASTAYSAFYQQRREYFENNKLDMEHYRLLSSSKKTLSDSAYPFLTRCVETLAKSENSNYGLSYVANRDDERGVTLQLFWRSTESKTLVLKGSVLENANVPNLDNKKYPGKLFADGWLDRNPRTPSGQGLTILLNRTKPEVPIRLTLTTELLVTSPIMTIDPVPSSDMKETSSPSRLSKNCSDPRRQGATEICYACDFEVSAKDQPWNATLPPFVCSNMPKGAQVMAILKSDWTTSTSNEIKWIDVNLEPIERPCAGNKNDSCFGEQIDGPLRDIYNNSVVPNNGVSTWLIRLSHCDSPKNKPDTCSAISGARLKVSILAGR